MYALGKYVEERNFEHGGRAVKRIILLVSLVCLVINFNGCLNENSFFEQKVNPYFYDVDYIALCATAEYYEVETREEKVIDIEVSLVKTYEQGDCINLQLNL